MSGYSHSVKGGKGAEEAKRENQRALVEQTELFRTRAHTHGEISEAAMVAAFPFASSVSGITPRIDLHLGVLHFHPSLEPFPLLADVAKYNPNTIDINCDAAEMAYWVGILQDAIPTVVEKAAQSEGNTPEAVRRAAAFGRAFDLHLTKLRSEPGAYGQLGLADLFELREECLREFGFEDVYRLDKERENEAALEVLPDLLAELDEMSPPERLLALIQGALAANIFDWGAKACVDLYHNATILDMYREARSKLSLRPWRVDDLDDFAEVWFSTESAGRVPYKRAIVFVDNAGADVVLGMLPLVRELLRGGCEVVLVANSLPAINDITACELRGVVAKAAEVCPIIKAARDAGVTAEAATLSSGGVGVGGVGGGVGGGTSGRGGVREVTVPPLAGLSKRGSVGTGLNMMGSASSDMPVARTAAGFAFSPSSSSPASNGIRPGSGSGMMQSSLLAVVEAEQGLHTNQDEVGDAEVGNGEVQNHTKTHVDEEAQGEHDSAVQTKDASGEPSYLINTTSPAPLQPPRPPPQSIMSPTTRRSSLAPKGMFGESYPSPWREPRLYIVASGSGSPCLDLRRVSSAVADATVGADLVIIEGMGRAIHTNLRTKLMCDVLKLAMIKNQHLARRLFKGDVYDCMCRFDEASSFAK